MISTALPPPHQPHAVEAEEEGLDVTNAHNIGVNGDNSDHPPVAKISLPLLIEFIVQKTYHDLTVLTELLPRKTDSERKIEIFEFASATRMLMVRLLAVVKWSSQGASEKVEKCYEIDNFLNKSMRMFSDVADSLSEMSRSGLLNAPLPNFHLPAAVEVLTTGSFNRVPRCIRDKIIPPDTLDMRKKVVTLSELDRILEYRIAMEFDDSPEFADTVSSNLRCCSAKVPQAMRQNIVIRNGCVTFTVENEFKATLALMGDTPHIHSEEKDGKKDSSVNPHPWRLIKFEILVCENKKVDENTGEVMCPKLSLDRSDIKATEIVHPKQVRFLEQLVQSRLVSYAEYETTLSSQNKVEFLEDEHNKKEMKKDSPKFSIEDPPLYDLYNVMHNFCQSLQLELFFKQLHTSPIMNRMMSSNLIRIESYVPSKYLTVSYWRHPLSKCFLSQQNVSKSSSNRNDFFYRTICMRMDCDEMLTAYHNPSLQIFTGDGCSEIFDHPDLKDYRHELHSQQDSLCEQQDSKLIVEVECHRAVSLGQDVCIERLLNSTVTLLSYQKLCQLKSILESIVDDCAITLNSQTLQLTVDFVKCCDKHPIACQEFINVVVHRRQGSFKVIYNGNTLVVPPPNQHIIESAQENSFQTKLSQFENILNQLNIITRDVKMKLADLVSEIRSEFLASILSRELQQLAIPTQLLRKSTVNIDGQTNIDDKSFIGYVDIPRKVFDTKSEHTLLVKLTKYGHDFGIMIKFANVNDEHNSDVISNKFMFTYFLVHNFSATGSNVLEQLDLSHKLEKCVSNLAERGPKTGNDLLKRRAWINIKPDLLLSKSISGHQNSQFALCLHDNIKQSLDIVRYVDAKLPVTILSNELNIYNQTSGNLFIYSVKNFVNMPDVDSVREGMFRRSSISIYDFPVYDAQSPSLTPHVKIFLDKHIKSVHLSLIRTFWRLEILFESSPLEGRSLKVSNRDEMLSYELGFAWEHPSKIIQAICSHLQPIYNIFKLIFLLNLDERGSQEDSLCKYTSPNFKVEVDEFKYKYITLSYNVSTGVSRHNKFKIRIDGSSEQGSDAFKLFFHSERSEVPNPHGLIKHFLEFEIRRHFNLSIFARNLERSLSLLSSLSELQLHSLMQMGVSLNQKVSNVFSQTFLVLPQSLTKYHVLFYNTFGLEVALSNERGNAHPSNIVIRDLSAQNPMNAINNTNEDNANEKQNLILHPLPYNFADFISEFKATTSSTSLSEDFKTEISNKNHPILRQCLATSQHEAALPSLKSGSGISFLVDCQTFHSMCSVSSKYRISQEDRVSPLYSYLGCAMLKRHLEQLIKSDEILTFVNESNNASNSLEFCVPPNFNCCSVYETSSNSNVCPQEMTATSSKIYDMQKLRFSTFPGGMVPPNSMQQAIAFILDTFFASTIPIRPFRPHALTAFVRLLQCPIGLLNDLLRLIHLQTNRYPEVDQAMKWHISLNLTVPPCAPPIIQIGQPGIMRLKDRMLLFFQLTRNFNSADLSAFGGALPQQPAMSVCIPIVYDINTNATNVSQKGPSPVVNFVHQHLTRLQRSGQLGVGSETGDMTSAPCTLFPSMRDLVMKFSMNNDGPPMKGMSAAGTPLPRSLFVSTEEWFNCLAAGSLDSLNNPPPPQQHASGGPMPPQQQQQSMGQMQPMDPSQIVVGHSVHPQPLPQHDGSINMMSPVQSMAPVSSSAINNPGMVGQPQNIHLSQPNQMMPPANQ